MTTPAHHRPRVVWTSPGDPDRSRRQMPRALTTPSSSERFTAWLVIVLLSASLSFTVYDLFLLITGLR